MVADPKQLMAFNFQDGGAIHMSPQKWGAGKTGEGGCAKSILKPLYTDTATSNRHHVLAARSIFYVDFRFNHHVHGQCVVLLTHLFPTLG